MLPLWRWVDTSDAMDDPVRTVDGDELRYLMHRETIHGAQYRDARRRHPVPYYLPGGPLDAVFAFADRREAPRAWSIIGLGTGALAARGREGDSMVFYETSKAVAECARRDFEYLEQSSADTEVRLEEGRRGVAGGDRTPDLVVVDAFVGDAFPLRLASREALEAYTTAAAEGAGILINVSVSHVSLGPLVAATAEEMGWFAWRATHRPGGSGGSSEGKDELFWDTTEWVFLLEAGEAAARFEERQSDWQRASGGGASALTDEMADRVPRVR